MSLVVLVAAGLSWALASRADLMAAGLCLTACALVGRPEGAELIWLGLAAPMWVLAWWRAQLHRVARPSLTVAAAGLSALAVGLSVADFGVSIGSLLVVTMALSSAVCALVALERPTSLRAARRWYRRVPVEGAPPME